MFSISRYKSYNQLLNQLVIGMKEGTARLPRRFFSPCPTREGVIPTEVGIQIFLLKII
jgi:hypothetical protein